MNVSQLDADVDFLCGSTSATYPIADKRRNQNVAYQDVARVIWASDGDWRYDDSNNTDAPIATKTVANASASYLIPTTALKIEGVEIKDASGDWTKLNPIAYHDMNQSPEEFLSEPGLPIYYSLDGNEIRLYPPPGTGDVTMSSGLAVRLARSVTELTTTATTYTPGFPDPFHRILSLAAAIDFEQDSKQREFLALQKARLEKGLSLFYAKRAAEFKTRIKPAFKKRWRSFI